MKLKLLVISCCFASGALFCDSILEQINKKSDAIASLRKKIKSGTVCAKSKCGPPCQTHKCDRSCCKQWE